MLPPCTSVIQRAIARPSPRAILLEMETSIPSAARLLAGTPAASPAPAPATAYAPRLDARAFAPAVTNPYFPLVPGTSYRFQGTGEMARETEVVTVAADTRMVAGIRATVVHDQVLEDGELVEDTYDWYAQDGEGNVWYLGEDSKEYRNGRVVSTEGSWEVGARGAQPGIII